ncbi:MAG: hypothetical protein ACR5K7_04150 [Symbiopectobacterium sp.]
MLSRTQTLLAYNVGITCVLAANDDMAISAAKMFLDTGKRVSQDMSLVEFDDMLIVRFSLYLFILEKMVRARHYFCGNTRD